MQNKGLSLYDLQTGYVVPATTGILRQEQKGEQTFLC